jgi:hypothetical protein
MLTLSSDVFEKIQRVSYSVYLVSFVNLASYITWACTLHYGLVQYFLSHEHAGTARRLHLVRIQSIDESALRRRAPRAAQRASRIRTFQRRLSEHAAKARRASVWDRAAKPRASTTRKHRAVWKSNLQPDFNASVCDCFDASSSAVFQELDESDRFVQKSAESTSI